MPTYSIRALRTGALPAAIKEAQAGRPATITNNGQRDAAIVGIPPEHRHRDATAVYATTEQIEAQGLERVPGVKALYLALDAAEKGGAGK